MIVQIYEIQTPFEAEKCIDLGVDHIGSVILSREEWRVAGLKKVIGLSAGTRAKNTILPLFSDLDTILVAMDYYRPDFIHLCQGVTDNKGNTLDLKGFIGLQKGIREHFPEIGIIRSIPVPRSKGLQGFPTLDIAREFEPFSDYFLIDTWLGQEPVEGYIGITGKKADWRVSKALVIQSKIPVILAGGLSPDNVYGGIMKVFPAGADSCTLTNMEDSSERPKRFEKDFKKVENFVREVRRAESDISIKRKRLVDKLDRLREELREREAALPAHSIRPHQLIGLEELEEKVADTERELISLPK
jgi:phosphoribosylanthranilate isomerase